MTLHDIDIEGQPLAEFWLSIGSDYLELANKALTLLMPFCTTYYANRGSLLYYYGSQNIEKYN